MHKDTEKRRDKYTREVWKLLSEFENLTFSGIRLKRVGHDILRILNLPNKSSMALQRTLLPYLGESLPSDRLEGIAQKLVWGRSALLRGKPIGKEFFSRRSISEALCDNVQVLKPRGKKLEFPPVLHFHILEDQLATMHITQRASPRFIGYLGCRIGLKTRNFRDFHPREFFHQRVKLVLTVKEGNIEIKDFFCPDSVERKNQQLKRARRSSECKMPCWACSKGVEECELATHTKPWVVGECSKEGKRTWFNEEGCVTCQDKIYKREAGILEFEPS